MTTSRSLRLGESEYERFRELVRERSGLDLAESRRSDLNRTLLQALIETVAPSIDGLYNLLVGDEGRGPLERLIARLTIGETYFFRNRPQFQALEQVILPGRFYCSPPT